MKNRITTTCFIVLFSLISYTSFAFAAPLTAYVDRNPVSLGQPFNLTILINNRGATGNPNLSALQQNFTVVGSARDEAINIINGKITRKKQWVITLLPKNSGKQIIPAILIGTLKTNPIAINVTSQNTVKVDKNSSVFIDATVDKKNPWIQSEVLYTLRLYYDTFIRGAAITPPTSDNAIIKQLDKDKVYKTTVNGRLLSVFQRSYIIFPQKSGHLVIHPPVLSGAMRNSTNRSSYYPSMFDFNLQPLHLVAPIITLNVKPKPAVAAGQWWLPAKSLELSQTWSQNPQQIKSGDPITRIITLKALGLTAGQLPPLKLPQLANVKRYPGNPELENSFNGSQIQGIRTEKIVYIAMQPGKLDLPAIKIAWWNTKTDKPEMAILPSVSVNIIPATKMATAIAAQTQPPIQTQLQAASPTLTAANNKINLTTQTMIKKSAVNYWLWLIVLLLIIGWLFTSLLWWRKHNKAKYALKNTTQDESQRRLQQGSTRVVSLRHAMKAIKKACDENNLIKIKQTLITWAQQQWPDKSIYNLATIASQIKFYELQQIIMELDKNSYSPTKTDWDSDAFWKLFKEALSKNKKSENKNNNGSEILPKLYLS